MPDAFYKSETDKVDYVFDWTDWLEPVSDTIASSTLEAEPSTGVTVTGGITSPVAVTVWVEGGTPEQKYVIKNQITTAAGRKRTRQVTVTIRDT